MSTPEAENAVKILTTWKGSTTIRQKFGTFNAYLAHMESPESSALKIIDDGGKISVVENKNRHLSPATALDIVKNWQNDPAIRAEFGSLNVYRAYIEAETTGKARIIGGR